MQKALYKSFPLIYNFGVPFLLDIAVYVIYNYTYANYFFVGKAHCRCILWTKDGPKRLVIQGAHKTRSVKTILGQLSPNVEQLPKEVSKVI